MAEVGAGTCPQVFVVDSNLISIPDEKKPRWAKVSQSFLLPLVGLTMLGLVIQGFFIYSLYKKTEHTNPSGSYFPLKNMSNPTEQQGDTMKQLGSEESNDIFSNRQQQQMPFAHLIGSSNPTGEENVVQWLHDNGDAITRGMGYDKGRLLIEKEGYYYIYTKVQVNASQECLLIQHKVIRDPIAYGHNVELMRSKSFRCRTTRGVRSSGGEDLWNSYLGGIFHLQKGDKIFVKLENQKIREGQTTDNFMGAFMIST